jgi:hypothetical protein
MYTVKGVYSNMDENGDLMTYKDMTFCEFYKDCEDGKTCDRALTEKVIKNAKKWWRGFNGEPPIAKFIEKPNCHKGIFFYNPENK